MSYPKKTSTVQEIQNGKSQRMLVDQAKRYQIKEQIITKLKSKFGKNLTAEMLNFLKGKAEEISNSQQIDINKISAIEKEMNKMLFNSKQAVKNAGPMAVIEKKNIETSVPQKEIIHEHPSQNPMPDQLPDEKDSWNQIVQYNKKIHEQNLIEEKQKKENTKKSLKNELERQIDQKKKLKLLEVDEHKKFVEQQIQKRNEEENKDKEKHDEKKEKIISQKKQAEDLLNRNMT